MHGTLAVAGSSGLNDRLLDSFSVVDCSLATPFDRSVRLYSIDPIVLHNHYHIYIYIII